MPEEVENAPEVDSTVFRAKVEPRVDPVPVEEQGTTGEDLVTIPNPDTTPISLREEPFIVEMLDMKDAVGDFDMKYLTDSIDRFVVEEIERTGMEDTEASYKEIIGSLTERLNLPDNVDVYTKIEKIAELARINQKLYTAVKDRDALLNSDPADLTSEQLRRKIENV